MTLHSLEENSDLDEKRDETITIEADLEKLRRLLALAKENEKEESVERLKEEISTQEQYLKDLSYEIKELEASSDGEEQKEEAEADADEAIGLGATDSGPEDSGTPGEDAGE